MIALAYGFGVESIWIHEKLHMEGKEHLLIVCKGPKDHMPKPINVLLEGENYKVLRQGFEEKWQIHEDVNPHRWSCASTTFGWPEQKTEPAYTNTIIEWAKQQPTRPFGMLYLGRRLEDMKDELKSPDAEFTPPENAFGFELKFPVWNWRRVKNCLLPPALELKT
jgi:hypothetical protein